MPDPNTDFTNYKCPRCGRLFSKPGWLTRNEKGKYYCDCTGHTGLAMKGRPDWTEMTPLAAEVIDATLTDEVVERATEWLFWRIVQNKRERSDQAWRDETKAFLLAIGFKEAENE